jgi:hypothetical protein
MEKSCQHLGRSSVYRGVPRAGAAGKDAGGVGVRRQLPPGPGRSIAVARPDSRGLCRRRPGSSWSRPLAPDERPAPRAFLGSGSLGPAGPGSRNSGVHPTLQGRGARSGRPGRSPWNPVRTIYVDAAGAEVTKEGSSGWDRALPQSDAEAEVGVIAQGNPRCQRQPCAGKGRRGPAPDLPGWVACPDRPGSFTGEIARTPAFPGWTPRRREPEPVVADRLPRRLPLGPGDRGRPSRRRQCPISYPDRPTSRPSATRSR